MSAGPLRVAVFASGSGSNFQAIADAAASGRLRATVELLVCDRPKAQVVERAEKRGIERLVLRPKEYPDRESYERAVLANLREKNIDLVCLAGYMRLLTPVLVGAYEGRMINIHPSLLPAFPGLAAIRQALEHGAKVTGATVHFVDNGLDSGPIIAQEAVAIREDDTEETLAERVHEAEHRLYPKAIGWLADGKVKLDGRIVRIG